MSEVGLFLLDSILFLWFISAVGVDGWFGFGLAEVDEGEMIYRVRS